MKQKLLITAAAATMLVGLSGCQTKAYQALYNWDITKGEQQEQPTTSRVAPLVVPPDYALRPTQVAGTRGPDSGGQEQVLDALFGGAAPRSNSERAVIGSAGNADPGIRSTVGDPDTTTVNKGSVTRDIIAAPEGDGQNAQATTPE